ncbi:hypothetical protein [Sorangium sp. So ce131]
MASLGQKADLRRLPWGYGLEVSGPRRRPAAARKRVLASTDLAELDL